MKKQSSVVVNTEEEKKKQEAGASSEDDRLLMRSDSIVLGKIEQVLQKLKFKEISQKLNAGL